MGDRISANLKPEEMPMPFLAKPQCLMLLCIRDAAVDMPMVRTS